MNLSQLSELAGSSRSLVYRTLKELESRALVAEVGGARSAGGNRYQLGVAVMELGSAFTTGTPFMKSARNVLHSLASRTEETASLAVLDGGQALYLMREEGPRSVFSVSQVGKRLPAYATGVGKALLATLEDDAVAEVIGDHPLRPLTPSTITSVDTLLQELSLIRSRGYAVEDGEVVEGRCCVAAAVKLPSGTVGEIGISVSTDRTRFEQFGAGLVDLLLQARSAIESEVRNRAELGGSFEPSVVATATALS